MVHRAMLTPQTLLSAPRRSAGVPNPLGTKVLYTTSTYSFSTHETSTELRLLDVATGEAELLAEDEEVSGLNWLDDGSFCYIGKDGKELVVCENGKKKVVGDFDGPVGDLKVRKIGGGGSWAVVVSGEVDAQTGQLFDPEKKKKTRSTGRLYKGLFVRHWDRWETAEKKAIWYGLLKKNGKSGKFELSKVKNALKGLKDLESPIRPFGGTDCFDLATDVNGKGGKIVFVSKDPVANPALNTKCNTYVVEMDAWDGEVKRMFEVKVSGYEGAATSPCFSSDGKKLVYLQMKTNGYEADRNDIFVLKMGGEDVGATREAKPVRAKMLSEGGPEFARSPSSVCWAEDGVSLLVTAEDVATSKVFLLKDITTGYMVWPLTSKGSISDVVCLSTGQIFISGSSLVDSSFYALIDPLLPHNAALNPAWTNSFSQNGTKFGLSETQVTSIYTPASNPKVTKSVHSLVIYPSNFHPAKTYPVAYLIHGGPQSAWADSWSTRWNPAIFAEQGYIVVAPNPTGSTGYGQAFTDAIRGNWGGDPYQDIVNVVEWVEKGNLKGADTERSVALGASYGGYMINWIQGHDLGRKFKSLVCHDGITSFAGGMLSTEEFYFPFHDLGGTPWYSPPSTSTVSNPHPSTSMSAWQKWDPSHHFSHWSTPQLVIHSSKDYRLPISEGLAAFNVLQSRGVESQFLTFPDENHWVLKPENSLLWHRVVLNWINGSVGLEAFSGEDEEIGEEYYGGVEEDSVREKEGK